MTVRIIEVAVTESTIASMKRRRELMGPESYRSMSPERHDEEMKKVNADLAFVLYHEINTEFKCNGWGL